MEKRFTRSTADRIVAGVCGGVGHYFGIDPTFVRLGFAAALLLSLGSPLLLYLLLWAIVPREDALDVAPREMVAANVKEMKTKTHELVDGVKAMIST